MRLWLCLSWTMNKPIGLYIHIPFCRKKCPYCDFYSVPLNEAAAEEYTKAVIRNLRHYGGKYDTVYFGGGTPILLADKIGGILRETDFAENAEITVECNPCDMDGNTLGFLKQAGVNRISVGVQSLNDSELSALGRRHTAEQAKRAIEAAAKAGFDNISADIMLAVPGQTAKSLSETIKGLSALPITHISAYLLKIEPNTVFGKKPPLLPDEDEQSELYLQAVEELSEKGFGQYEISNFAKPGYESRHNLKYWHREEYLGIGPAAHSFMNGKRFEVKRSIREFSEGKFQTENITDNSPDENEEKIMLGLRLCEGIPERLWKPLEKRLGLIPAEYYSIKQGRLSLTPRGFLVSNEIISTLLS